MKIEKLNDDKIRITLNLEDLKEKDIDLHSFMSNPIESQDLFMDMLEKAEKEVGFVTEDYRIMIEALATSNGTFVLTVTRIGEESKKTSRTKKLNIKRKISHIDSKKAIYCFESFDEFIGYCEFLQNDIFVHIEELLDNSKLYEYQDRYYLVLENLRMNNNLLKSFASSITEFAHFVNDSDLFESKLSEYGKIILKNHAIRDGLKYFC